jgi:hypothetical protein
MDGLWSDDVYATTLKQPFQIPENVIVIDLATLCSHEKIAASTKWQALVALDEQCLLVTACYP